MENCKNFIFNILQLLIVVELGRSACFIALYYTLCFIRILCPFYCFALYSVFESVSSTNPEFANVYLPTGIWIISTFCQRLCTATSCVQGPCTNYVTVFRSARTSSRAPVTLSSTFYTQKWSHFSQSNSVTLILSTLRNGNENGE